MNSLKISSQKAADHLKNQWLELRLADPDLRPLELAQMLGVSEAELVACRVGCGVIRLAEDSIIDIYKTLPEVGEITALTQNCACIHENNASFKEVSQIGNQIKIAGDNLNLCAYINSFHYAFAVTEESRGKILESIQFFDLNGSVIHKVYKKSNTNRKLWNRLINTFTALEQSPVIFIRNIPAQNTNYRMSQRATNDNVSYIADNSTAEFILYKLSVISLPVMVATNTQGLLQVNSGPIRNVKKMGCWLNVLDNNFNLHLRYDLIEKTVVNKQNTVNGCITSIDLYDKQDMPIIKFYGQDDANYVSLNSWTKLADSMVSPDHMIY